MKEKKEVQLRHLTEAIITTSMNKESQVIERPSQIKNTLKTYYELESLNVRGLSNKNSKKLMKVVEKIDHLVQAY